VVFLFRLSYLPWWALDLPDLDTTEDLIILKVVLAGPFPRVDREDTGAGRVDTHPVFRVSR